MLRTTQIGFTGGSPELRYVPSGDAVATVRVGTTDRWKDKEGEIHERTTWLRWECWGKSAENLAKLVGKGAQMLIEGSVRNESWEDKDGVTQYRDKYVVDQWRLLDRKPKEGGNENAGVGDAPPSGTSGQD
jgi:single-strand DNA-binding protein